MCVWEEFIYLRCEHRKREKMAYSCDSHTRHVYGPCRFDRRVDRVIKVYKDDWCRDPDCPYQYINYE
ncbi:hypothetical protein C8A05DRAFT_37060 [Staphylotrichum tortipilum]|uniref:Uncharacterized protein n=1 Tax=Staphylotrichum tortipilum TaxID=2831512 RepID=A0AAN6MFM8_9PEZI|nr:hypothetical protein C8A05DRAFT_37060 [Staphylotrichum longicolle]